MRVLFIAIFLLVLSHPVHAQGPGTGLAETAQAPTPLGDTRIEVDEEAKLIRFFIGGEEKARLDAEGFHVREGIRYGHDIIDYGPSSFDERFGEAADAE